MVKRIGLAKRTGRGVDLIYQGLLRYGRPAPDYSRSDNTTVIVSLLSTEADIPFLRLIVEEERRTASRLLRKLHASGKLELAGKGRGAHYKLS